MNNKKIKRLIVVLSVIFICIIVVLIIYLFNTNLINDNKEELPENNDNRNTIDLPKGDLPEEDPWAYEETILTQNSEEKKLKQITDTYSYFLVKQCLDKYYNPETVDEALNMLDVEVKEILNINENNVSNLYNNFNKPEFCIDKIYKQKVDASKDIYLVYHRLQNNSESNSSAINTVVFIKIDKKNVDFSIYPYEYLRNANYLELGQDDIITLNNLNDISENENNGYKTSLISKDDQTCIKEFYDRYKFDVKFDVEGLYYKLNEEYRNLKFPNIENFRYYINENKENIINGNIKKYEINKYDDYKDYVVICENDNPYIFSAESLMDYTILLDKYTVITKRYQEQYERALTGAQTKYCINRIVQAINDKNYDFVYQKLNVIQKNNYYKNIEDFKEFIDNNFYEKNNFEVDEDYLIVSSKIYQYKVKITDATESEFTYRRFTMAVTIKEGTDFEISIKNEN